MEGHERIRLFVALRLPDETVEQLSAWQHAELAAADARVVAYSNGAKEAQLGVPAALLQRHGAVSPEAAEAMAAGALGAFGADAAVAVTGIAGPGGGSAEKPVGLVYVTAVAPGGSSTQRFVFSGDREAVRARATAQSLHALRRIL